MKKIRLNCKLNPKDIDSILHQIKPYYRLSEDGTQLLTSEENYFKVLDIVRVESNKYKLDAVCDGTEKDVQKSLTVEKLLGHDVNGDEIRALGVDY